MRHPSPLTLLRIICLVFVLSACASEKSERPPDAMMVDEAHPGEEPALGWHTVQDTTAIVFTIEGLAGPESVRYDPDQDVFFISNFNGPGDARDGNGFISRVAPDGRMIALRFMTGTDRHPLHAPRGMFLLGDTLFVVDADGVHGFHRVTGKHLVFIDFTAFEPGFLNDLTAGPDGALYVTDTGASKIYRIRNRRARIVEEDMLLGPPNGITWDAEHERLLLAPWGGGQTLRAWRPEDRSLEIYAMSPGGYFDGVELVNGRILVSSQADSSLYLIENGHGRVLVKTAGRPADIGIDTKRMRVAVPYVALDRVDVWRLPGG